MRRFSALPGHRAPSLQREVLSNYQETTTAAIPAPLNDPLHSFIARRLVRFEGEMVAAGKVWQLWKADCEAHGIEPGTQQALYEVLEFSADVCRTTPISSSKSCRHRRCTDRRCRMTAKGDRGLKRAAPSSRHPKSPRHVRTA